MKPKTGQTNMLRMSERRCTKIDLVQGVAPTFSALLSGWIALLTHSRKFHTRSHRQRSNHCRSRPCKSELSPAATPTARSTWKSIHYRKTDIGEQCDVKCLEKTHAYFCPAQICSCLYWRISRKCNHVIDLD